MNKTHSKSEYIETLNKISGVKKCSPEKIIDLFRKSGGIVAIEDINVTHFNDYLNKIDYPTAFPNYYREFGPERQAPHVFNTKCLEHFLSFELCEIFGSQTLKIMDIAASNSPVTSILRMLGYPNVWKQDIQYTTNLDQFVIGGDAKRIDCQDNQFDALTLHNSWEHFEGDSPGSFLSEAYRILKPGGKLCIIPLFMNDIPFSLTSPDCWESKYKNVTSHPLFDSRMPILIDEGPKQRLIRVPNPQIIMDDLASVPGLDPKIYYFKNAIKYKFDPFALVCKKV